MNNGLQFMDAYLEDKDMFFSASNFNGLFRLKEGMTEAEFLGHFEAEFLWQKDIHRQVISVADKLYFIPYKGKGISIYKKTTGEISFVEIREKKYIPIVRAFLLENDIFMLPMSLVCPFIMFHTSSNTYEIIQELWDTLRALLPKKILFGMYSSCMVERQLYLKGAEGTLLCIDMDRWKVHIFELPEKYMLRNMYYDDGNIYFTLSDQCGVICWNCNKKIWREYFFANDPDDFYHPYMTVIRWGKQILLLPDRMDQVLRLDESKDEWYIQDDFVPEDFERICEKESLFLGFQCMNNELFLFPRAGNGMIILSETESSLCQIRYPDKMHDTVEKLKNQYAENQALRTMTMYENGKNEINLKYLLSGKTNILDRKSSKNNENVGKKIWNFCK